MTVAAGLATGGATGGAAAQAASRGAFHRLRVREVERLTDDAVALTLDVPDELAGVFAFVPGQSLAVRRVVDGVEQRRQYSLCAPAGGRPRVGVREVPDGLFSRWLVREVRPGDELEVQPPGGRFCPDPDLLDGGRHLCVAAGSGITPVLSVAATVLARGGEVALLYGNRTSGSVMFAEELADLKDRYGPRLQLVHVLSREPRGVELFSGRLDAERLRRLLTDVAPAAAYDHVWLCGPHAMTETAREVLAGLGVPADRVHRELFHVDAPPPAPRRPATAAAGAAARVEVTLDGSTSTATVPLDATLLDGLAATRADLPFACKGGVCGTCRARVVHGEVDMRRNYALEDAEVAAGFVLTCQTFPVGERVGVDFDA